MCGFYSARFPCWLCSMIPFGFCFHTPCFSYSVLGLSGGQRQALLLPRLFIRQPHIVLLDEPTASLDEASERNLIQNLSKWAGHRTLIIATHRMIVLSLVNRIIVVDNGRIVVDDSKDNAIARLSKPQKAAQ